MAGHLIEKAQILFENANSLLSYNTAAKNRHLSFSRSLQTLVISTLSKESEPTRECVKHLSCTLRIIRSVVYPLSNNSSARSGICIRSDHDKLDGFYRNLLPPIRKMIFHIQVIEKLDLSKNLDTNKDLILPFYLELMRYTRGIVDESPFCMLGGERGLAPGLAIPHFEGE